jgi:predicted DNA-binding transcriptional regulator AlpA
MKGPARVPSRLLLKKREVCELLSISFDTLDNLVADGHLPQPLQLGSTPSSRRWRFDELKKCISALPRSGVAHAA